MANPFAGSPVLTRTDATVDFDWGGGSPDASISSDHFSARWTGQVQPQFSETYTFYTNTDDGVRLWVDGKLLIDTWQDQGPTEWSGTIDLSAGHKYDLRMEYDENGGGAVAKLLWSSASRGKQIIPQERLFPVSSPPPDNEPPTAAQAAAAGYLNPGGVTVDLTVLGADDGGESALTYSWSTTGTPPASVSFSDNSTNAEKTTTAQFHEVGTHPLRVVIQDAQGLGVTSDVTVEVYAALTSIVPTPRTGFVSVGGTQQFTPHAYDQFGYEITPYRPPGGWFWSASGRGTITADGLFTAASGQGLGQGRVGVRGQCGVRGQVWGQGSVCISLHDIALKASLCSKSHPRANAKIPLLASLPARSAMVPRRRVLISAKDSCLTSGIEWLPAHAAAEYPRSRRDRQSFGQP